MDSRIEAWEEHTASLARMANALTALLAGACVEHCPLGPDQIWLKPSSAKKTALLGACPTNLNLHRVQAHNGLV